VREPVIVLDAKNWRQNMAMNALLNSNKPHGQGQQSQNSGLGGLAQSFLGGSHNNSSGHAGGSSSGAGGLVGQLAGSLLGGSKPHNQQQQQQSSGSHSGGGMLGNFLGGHNSVSASVSYPGFTLTEGLVWSTAGLWLFNDWLFERSLLGSGSSKFLSARCSSQCCPTRLRPEQSLWWRFAV